MPNGVKKGTRSRPAFANMDAPCPPSMQRGKGAKGTQLVSRNELRPLFRPAAIIHYGRLTASPPCDVDSARQTSSDTLLEKKRTEPSHMAALTPPECLLRAAWMVDIVA